MNPFIQDYLDSIKLVCPEVTSEELHKFSGELFVKEFKPKEVIFAKNVIQKEVCFVVKGLARAYYSSENEPDKTLWFISEKEFVTDYPAFLSEQASNYVFEAIENITLVFIPRIALEEAFDNFPTIQKYGRLVAEDVVKMEQERLQAFQIKTAKERYISILSHHANIINRASLGQIASVIGITRQSLTRIRKQLSASK